MGLSEIGSKECSPLGQVLMVVMVFAGQGAAPNEGPRSMSLQCAGNCEPYELSCTSAVLCTK